MIKDIKFLATDVAPNPKEITHWVDLKEDPTGGVIKTFDGKEWKSITSSNSGSTESENDTIVIETRFSEDTGQQYFINGVKGILELQGDSGSSVYLYSTEGYKIATNCVNNNKLLKLVMYLDQYNQSKRILTCIELIQQDDNLVCMFMGSSLAVFAFINSNEKPAA